MTIRLNDLSEYVREVYNDYISVYEHENHIRVTNGSAAMYGDIRIVNNRIHIKGQRHGNKIDSKYELSREGLRDALSELGL